MSAQADDKPDTAAASKPIPPPPSKRQAPPLLVIDFKTVCASAPEDMKKLYDKLDAMAKAGKRVYIVFYSDLSIEPCRDTIIAGSSVLREPDAWICNSGVDLYQKGYRTGDPYYASTLFKQWDPKPTTIMLSQAFEAEIDPMPLPEGADPFLTPIRFKKASSGTKPIDKLIEDMKSNLKSMGLSAEIRPDSLNKDVIVALPAKTGIAFACEFISSILGVPQENVCVAGEHELIQKVMPHDYLAISTKEARDLKPAGKGKVCVAKGDNLVVADVLRCLEESKFVS